MKKAEFHIPQDTLDKQAAASNPVNSVWVSANAGSGKTHVLAQRVIRLMLGGSDPSKILCLTYTRAAAANMSNRVFKELAAWTALDDDRLAAEIAKVEGARPNAAKLRLARRLFTKSLETPGGLKIQTIHAFCEAILHQFPLEANIAAHFQLLDGQMEQTLFAEAARDMVTGASVESGTALAEAFAYVLDQGGEWGLDKLLGEIIAKRAPLRQFIDQLRSVAPTMGHNYPQLYEEFGLAPDETPESIVRDLWPLPGLSPAEFTELHHVAHRAGASRLINDMLPVAEAGYQNKDPLRRFELVCEGLLKKTDGQPVAAGTFTKAVVAVLPDIYPRYLQAANALIAARDRLGLFKMVRATEAMVVIADILIARYERLKTERGFLDFGDLINRTVRLLSRQDVGPWVQYKLDRGIDHILLDEAQDTSPAQWAVVERLASEFFAGASARDEVKRTVFAVGDEKQSIYSFQGADPKIFAESGRRFERAVAAAERRFEKLELHLSFRSTQDVLDAVDLVFDAPESRRGISEDFKTAHEARRKGEPGYVEIWPSIGAGAHEQKEDWREAVDHVEAPAQQLAEQVAKTIKRWLDQGELLEGKRDDAGKSRRIVAGDILVLVRKRDRFVHALSRALKDMRIPVAGADRLRLGAHIAVQDMLALARFLQLSQDELALAGVLKSPVFGLTEEELFSVAGGEMKDVPLMHALKIAAQREPRFGRIVEDLERWRSEAAYRPPFEFFSGVLQRDQVRARMISRLGNEAGDMLDEFLSFCLAFELPGMPGLEPLIAALDAGGPEIKREMDQTRGEVRIMTVHASKGLEAPIVFLVDSGSASVSASHLPKLIPFAGKAALAGVEGYLWNIGKEAANAVTSGIVDGLKDLADDEYRRLLYVGMTRAEDRLIICGYHGQRQSDSSWHMLATRTLGPVSVATAHPAGGETALRYRSTPFDLAKLLAADETPKANPTPGDRLELGQTPSPPALPRPLTPSGAAALIQPVQVEGSLLQSPVLDLSRGSGFAARRGVILHKLLQVLPDIEPARRHEAAMNYLSHAAADWRPSQREQAWASVQAILENRDWQPLFSPKSRSETSIVGNLEVRGSQRIVSGQIDRIAVTDGEVLIVDYKTNRVPPANASEAPEAYILQMALYAELLKPLYAGKRVRAALLYTEGPDMIELPEDMLGESLARLTGA